MKLVLTHVYGPGKGRVDEFSDRVVTVGSSAANDVILADPAVAPEHARIYVAGERVRVACGEAAEVDLNGAPVRGEAELRDGDLIELGPCGPKLRFNIGLREPSGPGGGECTRRTKSLRLILHDAALRSREEAATSQRLRAPLFLRDVLEEVTQSSSRGLKIGLGALALAFAGGAAFLLVELGRWRAELDAERARRVAVEARVAEREAAAEAGEQRLREAYEKLDLESRRLSDTKRALAAGTDEQRRALTAEREESERRRAALIEEVRALEQKLARAEAAGTFADLADLARRYEQAIYLVTADPPGGPTIAVATAFAVRADGVLATNGHVAAAIDELEERVGAPVPFHCVMNKHPERRYEVVRYEIHPEFSTPFSPDVALFKIDTHGEPLPVVIPLAPADELRALGEGMPVVQIGFPGEEADPRAPIATFKQGYIGRITDFEKRSGDPSRAFLIQHSALTTKGTSGSPMIDARGRLIGVNNAAEGVRLVLGATVVGGREGDEFLYSASGINWGIRADLLNPMLEGF